MLNREDALLAFGRCRCDTPKLIQQLATDIAEIHIDTGKVGSEVVPWIRWME